MTLDRATIEQRLAEWAPGQRLMTVAEERVLAEDWLRKEEALQLVWAGRNASDLQTRLAYVRAALASQAEEEKPQEPQP